MKKDIPDILKEKINLLIKQKESGLTVKNFEKKNNFYKNRIFNIQTEILGNSPTKLNLTGIKINQSIYAYGVLNGLNNNQLSKIFNKSISVIGITKKFYDNLPFTYPYIRDNKIDLNTYDYAWEALKHIQNDNYEALIDHKLLNSVRRNNSKNEPKERKTVNENKFFQQLTPIENESQKQVIVETPQQYHIEPSNQITLTTSSGIKVYVPDSIDDEKLIKLTRFIRSL